MKAYIFPLLFLVLSISTPLFSQGDVNGGLHAFESFALPPSARVTALGGSLISIMDGDVSLATQNPALTNVLMDNKLSINHNFIFAGVSSSYLGFGKRFKKLGWDTHFGIQAINYGTFTQADAIGNQTGEFGARETGFIFGTARQLNERIRLGLNLKFAFGSYESYNSSGIAADIGLLYGIESDTSAQVSLLIRNLGTSLSSIGNENNPTPLDIQIGYARKLAHLPFRFSIVARNLQRWGVRYDDPNQQEEDNIFGKISQTSSFNQTIDNFFRHLVFGGAFLLGKSEQFRFRFSYNHLRKQELKSSSFRSLAGFAMGFGFNIKKIKFDYGVGYHHLAGGNNHISISIDLDQTFKKI